jgi:hypothetical protein
LSEEKDLISINRFPLPPAAPPIGDTSLTHVMKLAAHSTKPPTPTTMVQLFNNDPVVIYYTSFIRHHFVARVF